MSPLQGIKVFVKITVQFWQQLHSFGALYRTDRLRTQGVGKGRNCMHATTVPCCNVPCGACCWLMMLLAGLVPANYTVINITESEYYITSVIYSAHTRAIPGTVTQVASDVDSWWSSQRIQPIRNYHKRGRERPEGGVSKLNFGVKII